VLASVVPYAADLTALRYVPSRFFAVFMSIHPVLAALAGLVVLGQQLAGHEWAGIAVVVLANAVAVSLHGRPSRSAVSAPAPAECESEIIPCDGEGSSLLGVRWPDDSHARGHSLASVVGQCHALGEVHQWRRCARSCRRSQRSSQHFP
jgi:hypothetical protein